MDALRSYLRAQGRAFTMWANPQITPALYPLRASADYPLLELDEMLGCMLVYALIIAWGLWRWSLPATRAEYAARKAEEARRREEKKKAAAATAGAAAASWSLAAVRAKFDREPIAYVMLAYNAAQVLVCSYMVVGTLTAVFAPTYYPESRARTLGLPFCLPHDIRRSEVARMHWWFYVSKILDYADTVFMIVRGKWDQFSFLHTYHHLSVFPVQWIISTAGMDGDAQVLTPRPARTLRAWPSNP